MDKTSRVKLIIKGVLMAYIITMLLILVYAIILCYTDISESTIPTCIFIISIISVFIASSMHVIKIQEKRNKKWWANWIYLHSTNIFYK